jgi:NADH:ubiquinone oxidoreductase subunit D
MNEMAESVNIITQLINKLKKIKILDNKTGISKSFSGGM